MSEQRMANVVYVSGGGKLGNQVLRFAHWLAWAHENPGTTRITNLAFRPYAPLFELWSAHPRCTWPPVNDVSEILTRLRRLIPGRIRARLERELALLSGTLPGGARLSLNDAVGERMDLDGEDFALRVKAVRRLVCCGWRFSCWPLLEKHEKAVRAALRPVGTRQANAMRRVAEWGFGRDLLVGVFMRGTDYRSWHDGRFLYSAARYSEWMREAAALLAPRRVRFILTSDERFDLAEFAGLDWVLASGAVNCAGHWFDSFLDLAGCDYVLSPPSTFSACAAWLGGRPLWPLNSATQRLALAQVLANGLLDTRRDPVFGLAVK